MSICRSSSPRRTWSCIREPGRGYPVFTVAERDESVEVLFRRTDWFKVRTERGVEGWAAQSDMLRTVLADGTPFSFDLGDRAGFTSHHFEMGMFAGDYGGATLVSGYGSFSFNSQLAAELSVGQFLGKFSNGVVGDLGFTHVIVPEWRLSPFLMLGTGLVHISPKATLVLACASAPNRPPTSAVACASTSRAVSSCAPSTRAT